MVAVELGQGTLRGPDRRSDVPLDDDLGRGRDVDIDGETTTHLDSVPPDGPGHEQLIDRGSHPCSYRHRWVEADGQSDGERCLGILA